ncbi:RNA polymerase sigma factor [Crossiella sp. CA198]|uniref:RNA polymerase sigma factor n=1 Tax=Crossiella sp. CA198 TaxID=3455607 RepID=UPI003F8D6C49
MGIDSQWFARLYQDNYRRLVLVAYAMTNDLGDAEDLAQEAFAVAYRKRGQVAETENPAAWLRTVVVNLARKRWRRRSLLHRLMIPRAEPGPPADIGAEHAELHAAIGALDEQRRAVVVLHYLADLPVAEVAAVLRVPVGTVKSRLARARAALAQHLTMEVGHD